MRHKELRHTKIGAAICRLSGIFDLDSKLVAWSRAEKFTFVAVSKEQLEH